MWSSPRALVALAAVAALATASCGEADEAASVPSPAPADMCPVGEYPILAAYGLDDGLFRWAACDTSPDMHMALAATPTDVWVEVPYPPQVLRIDAGTGEIVDRTDGGYQADLPDDADRIRRTPPSSDEVVVTGGQDDPLIGVDRATRDERWRAVGFPVYDNIWAGDDEAVYVRSWDTSGSEPGTWIVAYAIDSGDERWRIDGSSIGWPWHASEGRVFAMWFDLQVIDADDGTLLWQTGYGEPTGGFPRMFGAVTNDNSVFVSFTSVGSDGD